MWWGFYNIGWRKCSNLGDLLSDTKTEAGKTKEKRFVFYHLRFYLSFYNSFFSTIAAIILASWLPDISYSPMPEDYWWTIEIWCKHGKSASF